MTKRKIPIMVNCSFESELNRFAQGKANADVNKNGDGITSADALSIQKFKLALIKELPESYS